MYVVVIKDLNEVLTYPYKTEKECKMRLEEEVGFHSCVSIEDAEQATIKNTTIYELQVGQKIPFWFKNNKAVLLSKKSNEAVL